MITSILPLVATVATLEPIDAMPAWDAPVFSGSLLAPNGRIIPGRVGVYTAEGVFLGDYSKGESILPNVDLVGMFESALADMRLEFSRHIMTGWGTLRVRYTLPGVNVETPDGKGVSLVVEIQNSYNGLFKVAGIIRALRLICANGMVGMAEAFALSKRHSGSLDVAGIVQTIAPQIEREAKQLGQNLRAMAEFALPLRDQVNVIRNLSGRSQKFPRRLARNIEKIVGAMDDTSDTRDTLWNLYNAGTRVLSERERDGIATADGQNQYWGLFVTALAEGRKFKVADYTAPRTREDAYGDEADAD